MNVKKIVEHICCDYTRGGLEDLCRPYFKDVQTAKRSDLEQVAFIIYAQNIDPAHIYRISTETKIIKEFCSAQQAVNYIKRNTIYNWIDEPEYPIERAETQERVKITKVGIRTA